MEQVHRSTRLLWSLAAFVLVAAGLAVLPQPAAAAPVICEEFGIARVDGGRYIVQNNRWGASTAQCIDVRGAGFEVIRADHNKPTNGPPASYPSVYVGCHYGNCTRGDGLPVRASEATSARGTYRIATPSSGEWNASYDLWFDPTRRTDGQNTGAELMIWANKRGGPQPIGRKVSEVNLAGARWDVWVGNIGWNVISYVRQSGTTSMVDFSIGSFISDAVRRGQVRSSWYLTSVQAGFEPWVGGRGLAVREFDFTARSGGGGTGGGGTGGGGGGTGGGGGGTGGGGDAVAIVNRGSDRCVDVVGQGRQNGTRVQLYDCWAQNPAQRWVRRGDTFVNPNSGKCLDVNRASRANGARVQIWTCHGGPAQRWRTRSDGALINPNSGKCLDAIGGSGANGTRLQTYDCDGRGAAPNQAWRLRSLR